MRKRRDIQPALKALSVFEEAARFSSFTEAARSLGMAQPSVSRFIANLEELLGVELFARRNNRIVLTTNGERLYEAAVLGLGHIRATIDDISAGQVKRPIMICCTHGFAHMWVLPRIDALKKLLDTREVTITTADDVSGFVTEGEYLVVRFGDGNWTDGLPELLFMEEVFPVCSAQFASSHGLLGKKLTASDLTGLTLLVQDRGEHGWLSWPGWFSRLGVDEAIPRTTHLVNNYAFVLQAAMEGKGIALAWRGLIEPYLSNGWLVELSGLGVTTGKGYYLMMSPDNPRKDVIRNWILQTKP